LSLPSPRRTIEGVSWWLLVVVLFAAPLVDSIVPVLPGEVVVAAAATPLAGQSLPVPAVIAVAAAGSLVGECIVLALARRLAATARGDRLIAGSKAARIRRLLERWGFGAVVLGRFLPGGRTATAATYALRRGSMTTFVLAAGAGSLVWAGYLVGVGSGISLIT
jgi:membrane protein DedA with SNARE-associated domain